MIQEGELMPLNPPQQEFVIYCLETYLEEFLDAISDASTFIEQLTLLKNTIESNDDDADESQCMLAKLLKYPQDYFLQLEKRTANGQAPLTVEEVQKFIIHFITPSLTKKASLLKIDISEEWDEDELCKPLSTSTPFVSKKGFIHVDNTNLLEFAEQGRVFSGQVNSDFPWVYVSVTTTLTPDRVINDRVPITSLIDENGDPLYFEDDDDEEAFLEEQVPDAKIQAELQAAIHILHFLTEKGIIQPAEYLPASRLTNANDPNKDKNFHTLKKHTLKLLSHEFYLDLLLSKKLTFSQLKDYTAEEVEYLTNPFIVSLIRNNVLRLYFISRLTPDKCRLLSSTYFHKALMDRKIAVRDLLRFSDGQCKVLIHPTTINLLINNKISLHEAVTLKPYQISLITYPNYNVLFTAQNADVNRWTMLSKLTEAQCAFRLRDDITKYCTHRNFSLKMMLTDLETHLESVYGTRLLNLLQKGDASIDELNRISPEVIAHFDTHPFLQSWLDNNLIDVERLGVRPLERIHCETYAKRLFFMYMHKPHRIGTESDSLDVLLKEIEQLAATYKTPKLKDGIIKKFILKLKVEFALHRENIYEECLEQIKIAENEEEPSQPDYWQEVLESLIIKMRMLPQSEPRDLAHSAPLPRRKVSGFKFFPFFFQNPETPFYSSLQDFEPLCKKSRHRLTASTDLLLR